MARRKELGSWLAAFQYGPLSSSELDVWWCQSSCQKEWYVNLLKRCTNALSRGIWSNCQSACENGELLCSITRTKTAIFCASFGAKSTISGIIIGATLGKVLSVNLSSLRPVFLCHKFSLSVRNLFHLRMIKFLNFYLF